MTSTAYRQSSRRPSVAADQSESGFGGEQIDPENHLLWRMNLRRLEAEVIRDSILAVAGSLDFTAGGPPVEITMPADGIPTPICRAVTKSIRAYAEPIKTRRF